MTFLEKVGEHVKKGKEIAQRGKELAIKKAEKSLRIERLKIDIDDMRKKKDRDMRTLARKVYELYCQNQLDNQELVNLCQEIKTTQWQIDEKWSEVSHLKEVKE
jgi:signal transduction protein with GAF and PtsI domain